MSAVALLLGVWIGAPSVAAAGPVRAEGTITFTGTRSFVVALDVPKSTVLHYSSTYVTGGGRWWGFILRRDGDPSTSAMLDLRAGDCTTPGCPPMNTAFGAYCYCMAGNAELESQPVPKGRYHLYFVADVRAASVRLDFGGVGNRVVRTGQSLAVRWIEPPAARAAAPASNAEPALWSSGAKFAVAPQGGFFGFDMYRYQSIPDAPLLMGICVSGTAAPSGANGAAYQYPCTRGDSGAGNVDVFVPQLVGSHGSNRPGPIALVNDSVSSVYTSLVGRIDRAYFGGFLNTLQPAAAGSMNLVVFDFLPGTTRD